MTSLERLKPLTACRDTVSLRLAVSALCAEFGKVTQMEIVTVADAEKRQALCFLRLASRAQEQELMSGLGAARFGADLLVVINMQASARAS